MRIQLTIIWVLKFFHFLQALGHVHGHARILKQKVQKFKELPSDHTTGCQVMLNINHYIIGGGKCSKMPHDYRINGTNLSIMATSITSLEEGDLDQYPHVKSLSIEMNTKLVKISPGAFRFMENLINLTITNNIQFQNLDSESFRGLTRLERLVLVKNNFTDFYSISVAARASILPRLISLDVSRNSIVSINYNDALSLSGSPIQFLHLSACGLYYIEGNSFSHLPHLRALHIDYNALKTPIIVDLILNISRNAANFTKIFVGTNYLDEPNRLLESLSRTKISYIDISRIHFSEAIPHDLPPLPSVVYINFYSGYASSKACEYFTSKQFPNLEFLYLARNQLLDTHFSMSLPKLKVLDLSENIRTHGYVSIFGQGDFNLRGMTSLEYLALNSNPIGPLKDSYFQGLVSLRELRLSNASIFKIEPDSFASLEALEVLDLSYNSFEISFTINNRTFTGLNNLKKLHLDGSKITCLRDDDIFTHTPQLEVLTLKRNLLLELHHHLLNPVPLLYHLDLSRNAFQSWDEQIFANNTGLEELDLSDNQISAFSPAMLRDLSVLKLINIEENPLSCNCPDLSNLFPYVNSSGEDALMRAFKESTPFCSSPISARFTPFLERLKAMSDENDCTLLDETHKIIKFVVIGICVVILVGTPSIYFLRWHIKYWMFLVRQGLSGYIFPKRKMPEPPGQYSYDAFVSYSNEDRGFVVRLVSMLESHAPHFRLCVYERDFSVGGVITENVVDCLTKSRRTILILSDSFAKSNWCQWEMSLAQHKRLFFKDAHHGPLIIIKIGEIMEKHMTPTLRYLIRTRIYLQWDSDPIKQKMFWQKLRSALAAPLQVENRSGLQHSVLSNGETVNNNDIAMESYYTNKTFEV